MTADQWADVMYRPDCAPIRLDPWDVQRIYEAMKAERSEAAELLTRLVYLDPATELAEARKRGKSCDG